MHLALFAPFALRSILLAAVLVSIIHSLSLFTPTTLLPDLMSFLGVVGAICTTFNRFGYNFDGLPMIGSAVVSRSVVSRYPDQPSLVAPP